MTHAKEVTMTQRLRRSAAIVAAGSLTACLAVVTLAQGDPAKKPADQKAAPAARHIMLDANQLKWGPGPPALPAGAQVAILDGDPSKPGPFAIRVKVPDGYTVPPHWHPTDENLVILSGTLSMGVGDKFDQASMHALTAGSYIKMTAKTRHYVRAKGETTFQAWGVGPFTITYVDPKDDPRKKPTS
jgi:mannose-6-phosphate isomerase-like protein (cupin superfamily)